MTDGAAGKATGSCLDTVEFTIVGICGLTLARPEWLDFAGNGT